MTGFIERANIIGVEKIKEIARKIIHLPYWVFLGLFLLSFVICIAALRHNNQTMIILRNEVYTADKNKGDVNAALNNLRNYVYSHMNTNLTSGGNAIKPPIQLKYTYERLTSAAQASSNNTGLYTEAENYCQAKIPASVSISGRGRIACVQDYILSHGGQQAPAVPTALYEFDFLSPSWSPDLAGWTLLTSVILFFAALASYLAYRLSHHQRG